MSLIKKSNKKENKKVTYLKIERINFAKDQYVSINVTTYMKDLKSKDKRECIFISNEEFTAQIDNELFSLEELNKKDSNIFKSGYIWIKENIEKYSDFEDC